MSYLRVKIDAIRKSQLEKFKDKATLILKEDNSERYLPIVINSEQADILAKEITGNISIELSSAPEIFLSGVNASTSDIICVTIHFENDIYYAKVLLYPQDEPLDVKCPIGVALSLAFRTQVPMLVSAEVMNKWALALNGESTWGTSNSIIKTTDVINSIAREALHF